MKYIFIPIRVFETGDKVVTKDGLPATVIHDEMEGFDREHASTLSCSLTSACVAKAEENALYRTGVILNMGGNEITMDRNSINLEGNKI